MAKKFYGVRIGNQPGIYESWEDCQKQIKSFSGAIYKGFATREEAAAFVKGEEQSPADGEGVRAYVDGSYDAVSHQFSYGMVILNQGEELHFSEKYDDIILAEMHNVAGEIKGSEAAMQYCLDNGISEVTIYHDYEGIAKWCTGEWKARKRGTIAYTEFYTEAAEKINIRFVKVKGHSGDKYNEIADQLAKKALGIR